MVTGILAAIVVWCLFYGRLALLPLLLIAAGSGLLLARRGIHDHTRFLTIDVLAQTSKLNRVHPGLKSWTVLALMAVCIAARSPVVGMALAVVLPVFTVSIGGLRLHDYLHLMALPVTFLLLSGLALLFEVTRQPAGVLRFPLFGFWFCVSAESQAMTALVIARALGAVSCLYLLSLTTPLSDIIGVMRRARCPGVVINLMYLIYRYLFILLTMHGAMRDAARSRLGYESYQTGVRTTGSIYSNLLARSYQQANRNFDAMESRCFDEDIRFLESRHDILAAHVIASAVLLAAALAMCFTLW